MNDDHGITRENYDPLNDPSHRVAPVVAPDLVAPSMPPRDQEAAQVAAIVPLESRQPTEPVVDGRLEDRPHFLRNVDGIEFCGQCGQPFPCDTYRQTVAAVSGVLIDLDTAAAAAGLTVPEFRARLEAQGRRYP